MGDFVFQAVTILFFAIFTLSCIIPFYYLFINTISDNNLVMTGQINIVPKGVHFNNYASLLRNEALLRSALVTVQRTVIGTAVMVVASALVGFLITQQKMFARKVVYRYIVITMYFNAGLLPWFLNMHMLGLTNNFLGYIIPAVIQPFNIILVKTYIESIPAELEESAFIDGAGYLMVFWKIIMPLCKPILATIAVFGAVGHWNAITDSLILMSAQPKLFTLQHLLYNYTARANDALQKMSEQGNISVSDIAAALNARVVSLSIAMVTIIPILLVYPFMSRYFQKGIMLGAVKG